MSSAPLTVGENDKNLMECVEMFALKVVAE